MPSNCIIGWFVCIRCCRVQKSLFSPSTLKNAKQNNFVWNFTTAGFWRPSPGFCVEEGSRYVRNLLFSLTYCLAMFIQEILYVKCCWTWYVTASNLCGTLAIFFMKMNQLFRKTLIIRRDWKLREQIKNAVRGREQKLQQ